MVFIFRTTALNSLFFSTFKDSLSLRDDAFQNMKVHNSPSVAVGISLKSGLLELTLQSEEPFF